MRVGGTGSRSLQNAPLEEKKRVLNHIITHPLVGIRTLKKEHDNVKGIWPGAEGFDSALAKAFILEDVPYLALLPSPSYGEYYWRDHSVTGQNRYSVFEYYLDHAEGVVYVCESHMYGKANFIRNEELVRRADNMFVYDAGTSGTKHCLKLIRAAGVPHHIVPMPE